MEIEITQETLSLLGVLIPVLTAALVRVRPDGNQSTPAKAIIAIVLTTLIAVVQELVRDKVPGESFNLNEVGKEWIGIFAIQLLSYLGFWKPVPVAGSKVGEVPLAGKLALAA